MRQPMLRNLFQSLRQVAALLLLLPASLCPASSDAPTWYPDAALLHDLAPPVLVRVQKHAKGVQAPPIDPYSMQRPLVLTVVPSLAPYIGPQTQIVCWQGKEGLGILPPIMMVATSTNGEQLLGDLDYSIGIGARTNRTTTVRSFASGRQLLITYMDSLAEEPTWNVRLSHMNATAPEAGIISGILFYREYWSAVYQQGSDFYYLHGFVYAARDGHNLIVIAAISAEPNPIDDIELMETAARTMAPAPPAFLKQTPRLLVGNRDALIR